MGKPVPLYDIDLLDGDGNSVARSARTARSSSARAITFPAACSRATTATRKRRAKPGTTAYYHTGDVAWRDEDGYFWYVGRADDVIKSSGYRIGPFEIENVIMELPYVLECGVSAAPDEVRGQVVKASIVLTQGHRSRPRSSKRRSRTMSRSTPRRINTRASWSSATSCPRPSAARSMRNQALIAAPARRQQCERFETNQTSRLTHSNGVC